MKQGEEPFVSTNTLHQLHILIFVLACVHVGYSCLTMVLSLTKVITKFPPASILLGYLDALAFFRLLLLINRALMTNLMRHEI